MILFRLTYFSLAWYFAAPCFALQINAPEEIYNAVLEYANAAGGFGNAGASGVADILQVKLKNNGKQNCVLFELSLIKNGKIIKTVKSAESEAHSSNLALQNAVLEIFGNKIERQKEESSIGNGARAAIASFGIAALWAIFYLTEPPKPVDVGQRYKIEVKE